MTYGYLKKKKIIIVDRRHAHLIYYIKYRDTLHTSHTYTLWVIHLYYLRNVLCWHKLIIFKQKLSFFYYTSLSK